MISATRILEGTVVPTAPGIMYTSPVNQTTLIKKLVFANTTAGALQLSVYLVPSGGGPSSTNAIRTAKTLAPYETFECYEAENQVLVAGASLAAAASAAGITASASGLLIT